MGNSWAACCNGVAEDELFEADYENPIDDSKVNSVYNTGRDHELNQLKRQPLFLRINRDWAVDSNVSSAEKICSKISSGSGTREEKGGMVMRVKIVLTKQELEQLMSKCQLVEGGILHEIARDLERNRSDTVVSGVREPWKPVLASIPEEC